MKRKANPPTILGKPMRRIPMRSARPWWHWRVGVVVVQLLPSPVGYQARIYCFGNTFCDQAHRVTPQKAARWAHLKLSRMFWALAHAQGIQ